MLNLAVCARWLAHRNGWLDLGRPDTHQRGTTMAQERAVLAGGCFWGMQDLIRKLSGVESTRVGYTGGDVPQATYRNHSVAPSHTQLYSPVLRVLSCGSEWGGAE